MNKDGFTMFYNSKQMGGFTIDRRGKMLTEQLLYNKGRRRPTAAVRRPRS